MCHTYVNVGVYLHNGKILEQTTSPEQCNYNAVLQNLLDDKNHILFLSSSWTGEQFQCRYRYVQHDADNFMIDLRMKEDSNLTIYRSHCNTTTDILFPVNESRLDTNCLNIPASVDDDDTNISNTVRPRIDGEEEGREGDPVMGMVIACLFAVGGIVSIVGVVCYNRYKSMKEEENEQRNSSNNNSYRRSLTLEKKKKENRYKSSSITSGSSARANGHRDSL